MEAIVDDEDYERVKAFAWHACPGRNTWYAGRGISTPRGVRRMRLHQFIMAPPAGMCVDHKNGNGLDNRRENLRIATRGQNKSNARKRAPASSRFKGVSWDARERKWRAYVSKDKRRIYLGYFTDEVSAARAYDDAAYEAHGEFALTNFPLEGVA